MRNRMQQELEVLLDTITMNICYPVSPGDLELLRQQAFYFNICTIIFPELNIKIVKIGQDQSLVEYQKMQKLLELLTEQLQINLAALSGQEILNGNFLHTYKFLKILKEFSQLPPLKFNPPKDKFRQRLHSCPLTYSSEIDYTKQPQSARIQPKQRNLTLLQQDYDENMHIQQKQNSIKEIKQEIKNSLYQMDDNQQVQNQNKKQAKNIRNKSAKLSKPKKRKKEFDQKKIVKKCLNQKQQNKSNKKYQSYLQGLMKSQKSKKKKVNAPIRPKSANKVSWTQEVKEIDEFFKSFEYKIRDQKQRYLRKMQEIIRDQQNERMRIQKRMSLERSRAVQRQQKNMIGNLMNMHKTKIDILKERAESNKQSISLIKKQQQQELRTSKKQVIHKKKEQLKQIKNYITQLNNKVLMKLQQGGQLQKVVHNIYNKF